MAAVAAAPHRGSLLGRAGYLAASAVVLVAALAPFVWILIIAVTPETQQFARQVHYLPESASLENFGKIFAANSFGRAFLNSVFVAVAVTELALMLAMPAGYGFARFQFVGRRLLIVSMLLIYMLPAILLLVPMMVIFKLMGILNTYLALVLAESTHAIPFAVWMLANYFGSLPRDLEEAAQVDGCTRFGAMWRVAVPLALPGVVASGLFVFIASWNDFLFAFMFTSGESVRTLPVILRGFVTAETGLQWGAIMAGAVVTTLPVAAAFLVFQRYLIGGLTTGGVKG